MAPSPRRGWRQPGAVASGQQRIDAIRFNDTTVPTQNDTLAYVLDINHYNGIERPQLRIEAIVNA